jgi:hypothetical protein
VLSWYTFMRSIRLGVLVIDRPRGNPADPESLKAAKLTR